MYQHVHFIGIGGISMSALAKILLRRGVRVSGSDITDTKIVEELRELGAEIAIPHAAQNITNPDIVVFTSAIAPDNPELLAAKEKGIRLVERADMVGHIMEHYPKSIAVAGTHGKTTTTSMLTYMLLEAGFDPTAMVGGELDILGGNLRVGHSDCLVTEACEYKRNFLKFQPFLSMILNIEADHLDYYRDLEDVISAFSDFAALPPENGAVVINADDPNCLRAAKHARGRVITAGLCQADCTAQDIAYGTDGCAAFTLCWQGRQIGRAKLRVPGAHNLSNALCAAAAMLFLQADEDAVLQGLERFGGAKRRFERRGTFGGGVLLIDDYAHHPTEIATTLASAKQMHAGTVWCIFQPHTYTRTKALLHQFADALKAADRLIMADIYAAREPDTGLVSSKDLADLVPGAVYIQGFAPIANYIRAHAKPGDIVITMGAGDVFQIGDMLLHGDAACK